MNATQEFVVTFLVCSCVMKKEENQCKSEQNLFQDLDLLQARAFIGFLVSLSN